MKKSLAMTTPYALLPIVLILSACSSFGGEHSPQNLKHYSTSPSYNQESQRFENTHQDQIDLMKDKVFSFKFIVKLLFPADNLRPSGLLPAKNIDFAAFLAPSLSAKLIWLGHSSFLVRIANKTILIDPVFNNAGPFFFLGRRFQPSIVRIEDLPPVDYILISHDHFDHLEMETAQFFARTATKYIVPLGVGTHLSYWGVPEQNIVEHDWWGSHQDGELEVVLTPSRHYSGRSGFLANDTLWGSFVIRDSSSRIYYSGDSGYDSHFKEIAERYGPFQIALVENGQYHEISRQIHLFPEDALQAFKDLHAQTLVPVHWGMFALSQHPWDEPIKKIHQLAKEHGVDFYMPKIGEIFSTERPRSFESWWEF